MVEITEACARVCDFSSVNGAPYTSQPRGLKARSNILTMPQSLSLVIIHIIFSTKDLKPVPTMSISHRRMHPYVARTGSTCDLEELIPGFPQKYVKNGSKAKECRK
jgi:hypothetical protein